MIEFFLQFNTFTNAMAVGFAVIGAARPHIFAEDPAIRIGAFIAVFGLLAQAARNIEFFATGISPADIEAPFWALKDLGLVIMIYGYAMRPNPTVKG